jgi:hypothetical protein
MGLVPRAPQGLAPHDVRWSCKRTRAAGRSLQFTVNLFKNASAALRERRHGEAHIHRVPRSRVQGGRCRRGRRRAQQRAHLALEPDRRAHAERQERPVVEHAPVAPTCQQLGGVHREAGLRHLHEGTLHDARVEGGRARHLLARRSQEEGRENGRRDPNYEFGTNPCGEIILRSAGFCNLSEACCVPTIRSRR